MAEPPDPVTFSFVENTTGRGRPGLSIASGGAVAQEMQPGQLIGGRYRLITVLGSGGFGRTWRAFDETRRVDVVIEEHLLSASSDDERSKFVARFQREIRNTAGLRAHPNIAAVDDVVIERGTPWAVSRLINGRSLADYLAARGPLSGDHAERVARGLLEALDSIHAAGLVHRDVKPSNVLLAESGDVVLIDLGIAAALDDSSVTRTGEIGGSPAYMAPEQARGASASAASDLFSLGATLYAAVEGFSPFQRATAFESIDAVVRDQVPLPQRGGNLNVLIARLLEKDPARRPTVQESLDLLVHATSGRDTGHPLPVAELAAVYLGDGAAHEQVEAAIEKWLEAAGLTVVERDEPIVGSWFRSLRVALRSPAAATAGRLASHAAETKFVTSEDAKITAALLQNLGPVLAAIQSEKNATVWVGSACRLRSEIDQCSAVGFGTSLSSCSGSPWR